MGLSVVIITYNEAHNIVKCIASLSSISDDIVVVDANSTDGTRIAADKKNVRVFTKTWTSYSDAKNYGNSLARYDWILSIDADEIISTQLQESILKAKLQDQHIYAVRRHNYINKRKLKYSHIHPEWKCRIFNRIDYKWDEKPVHELLTPKTNQIVKLSGELIHHQADSIEELSLSQLNYARLSSNKRNSKTVKTLSPYFHFFRSFIIMGGIFEGKLGWQLAKVAFLYAYKKYNYSASDQAK